MDSIDRGRQWLCIVIVIVMAYVLTYIIGSNIPISGLGIVAVLLGISVFAGAAPVLLLHYIFQVDVTRKDASASALVVSSIWGVAAAFGALHILPIAIFGLPVAMFIAWGSSQLTCILIAKAQSNVGEVHG